jgi:CBS domain-containing protein
MNTRREAQTDAMLRHLGAAYYDSLHGRASKTDVVRALRSLEDGLDKQPGQQPGTARRRHHTVPGHGTWRHRVRDVMTTSVITIDRITPFKEIATLLADHKISGVPVLSMGRKVAGVVSEADLLRMEEPAARSYRLGNPRRQHWWKSDAHLGYTAAKLMTSPAITIHPDATLPAAARLLNDHHIRRLPVVDPNGALIGIVSRSDLLKVFLRPDAEIADEARQMITPLLGDPPEVAVRVRSGIVTVAGQTERTDLIPVALGLIADIDGVVTVLDKISPLAPAAAGE